MVEVVGFYPLAIIAIMVAGISKGGFGGGLGVIAVPLMSLAVSPFQAAAIMLPILCVMDLASVKAYWRQWDYTNLKIMIPGAGVGVVLGAVTYQWVSEEALRLLVGFIALAFAANFYLKAIVRTRAVARPASTGRGLFWSTLAGFTSFSAHAGGPPTNIYLLPQKMHKTQLVGTTVLFFAFINYLKLIPYALLGQFVPGNLLTSLLLAPVAVLGVYLGLWLHKRVATGLFYQICYALLALTGARLLYQGVVALQGPAG